MKKIRFWMVMVFALLLLAVAGCGAGSSKAPAEASTLSGTMDEIKDFMFVVKDSGGTYYAFSFDGSEKPEGLEDVAVGDRVTVTYTGQLSEVDSFTGEIISVEKTQ